MTAIVTSAVANAVDTPIELLGSMCLIALLVARELAGASGGQKLKVFAEYSLVAVVPLLLVFFFVVFVTMLELMP